MRTVTIDGREYPVEQILERVEPVQPKPRVGQVWTCEGNPHVVIGFGADFPQYAKAIELCGSHITHIYGDYWQYAAPSVEAYYAEKLKEEHRRGLEEGAGWKRGIGSSEVLK